MAKSTFAAGVCRVVLFTLPSVILPAPSEGQITFKTIDPRQMELVPLQKPIQPSLPYLPKPGLNQDFILPDRIDFTPITKDNITFKRLRPDQLEPGILPKSTIVQQKIAPPWLPQDIRGPERLTEQPFIQRHSFQYQSPIFLPATRPRRGFNDAMLLTPTLFSDRPPDGSRGGSSAKKTGSAGGKGRTAAKKAPSSGGQLQPEAAGPRSLGW